MSAPALAEWERALIRTYRKRLWSPFVRAIREFELIEDGDGIAVAISGGKDSLLMAKLFQELHKHGKRNFSLQFIAMDPGYAPEKRADLENLVEQLDIPVDIYATDVFAVAEKMAGEYPCYMCARMRRGALYAKAQSLGCNVLALGHHFDDVIETILLNVLYGGKYNTMMPKLRAKNFPGMRLIRPLTYIREADIRRFFHMTGLEPLDCACSVTARRTGNQRYMVKALIARLKDEIPNVEQSIFRSAQNVNLDQLLGYTEGTRRVSFLDRWEETSS